MSYNVEFQPRYTNNEEYRACLRRLFQMQKEQYAPAIEELQDHLGNDLDKETQDENEFDSSAASSAMDTVYEKTKDNPLFRDIYSQAAAKMISLDPQIGLAVCFSYDYLDIFHACLVDYLRAPSEFTENSSSFKILKQKI